MNTDGHTESQERQGAFTVGKKPFLPPNLQLQHCLGLMTKT